MDKYYKIMYRYRKSKELCFEGLGPAYESLEEVNKYISRQRELHIENGNYQEEIDYRIVEFKPRIIAETSNTKEALDLENFNKTWGIDND